MKYQLVLQWPASSIDEYDTLISIEDLLIERLPGDSEVDGHDMGSGQMNIFILTDMPMKTFNEIKDIFEDTEHWNNIQIAYRDIEQSDYVIIWPNDPAEFHVL